MGSRYKLVRVLVLLSQLGFSVAFPPAGFILGAVWLRERYDLGIWVLIVGIVLGFAGAAEGLWSTLKAADILLKDDGRKEKRDSEPGKRK